MRFTHIIYNFIMFTCLPISVKICHVAHSLVDDVHIISNQFSPLIEPSSEHILMRSFN